MLNECEQLESLKSQGSKVDKILLPLNKGVWGDRTIYRILEKQVGRARRIVRTEQIHLFISLVLK